MDVKRKSKSWRAVEIICFILLLGVLSAGIIWRFRAEPAVDTAESMPIIEEKLTDLIEIAEPKELPEHTAEPTEKPVVQISIEGNQIASDIETITISGEYDELIKNKTVFTNLKYIEIKRALELDELETLCDAFQDATTECGIELFGKSFSSLDEELDFSNTPFTLSDLETMKRLVDVMPRLEKVVMSDCGISDEDMDTFNRSVETVDFVWTVHFKVYSVRTDSTYFCCSDLPWHNYECWPMTDSDFAPLRYCHELVALDLGHENIADLSFLYEMPKLRFLIIITTHNHIDLTPIASLKELYYLEVFNNDFSDLSPLLECPKLKHLNIGYCWRGEYSKEPLYEMTGLERLWAPGCGLSAEECERIEEALPNTQCFFEGTTEQSTGGGWRDSDAYRALRDELHMFY